MVHGPSRLRFINIDRTRLPVRDRIRPRGVPNALQDHPVVDTADAVEAANVTSQLLGPARLHPRQAGGRPLHCQLHAVQLLDLTLAHLDYGGATSVSVTGAAEAYTVHMTSAGHARVELRGRELELTPFFALVVSPGTPYTLHLEDDSPQTILRIERASLERQLSRLLGRALDQPVVFEPLGDLTTDAATRWHGALQLMHTEVLSTGSLVHQGVGAGPVEELVVSTLLYVQESNYSDRLHGRVGRSGRPAVRRSIDYIEQHLAEPICLEDLATHVRMSPRSIQAGFREDLDTTPLAFIRDRRLDAVRRTLLEALPGELTVTEAAVRWGFTHLGQFSGVYRQRFGESPSQTLKGMRSA